MSRVSYPTPCLLAVRSATRSRREDLDRGTLWTDEEVATLTHCAGRETVPDLARYLRRSEDAVRVKAARLGLCLDLHPEVLAVKISEFRSRARQLALALGGVAA